MDRGRVLVDLDEHEKRVLTSLIEAAAAALVDTTDAARGRLLPDGYREDAEAAAEFARYTRDDLRRSKLDAIGAMLATLDAAAARRIPLDHDEADSWARVLTDVRLVLAERAGIRHDDDLPSDPDQHRIYAWTGHLQWSLVQALDRLERKSRGAGRV